MTIKPWSRMKSDLVPAFRSSIPCQREGLETRKAQCVSGYLGNRFTEALWFELMTCSLRINAFLTRYVQWLCPIVVAYQTPSKVSDHGRPVMSASPVPQKTRRIRSDGR
ncbi:hypothetical protein TNCV_4041331 [Trichonephila clavipes]|nr:hypothetical protein TNCV_4041331 [Trichonephila clavipes]